MVGDEIENAPRACVVKRCGARTRSGSPCKNYAMRNGSGRCKFHGGMSTGPRTAAGKARVGQAQLKHGRFTKVAKEKRKRDRLLVRSMRELLDTLK